MDGKRQASGDADIINRVIGESKKGKKMKVGQHNSGMFYLTWTDGGKIPKSLRGRYMNYRQAEEAAKQYLHGA